MKLLALHANQQSLVQDLREVEGLGPQAATIVESNSLAHAVDALAKHPNLDLIVVSVATAGNRCARWNAILKSQVVQVPIVFVNDTADLTAVAGAVLKRLIICPLSTAAGRSMFSTIIDGIRLRKLEAERAVKAKAAAAMIGDNLHGNAAAGLEELGSEPLPTPKLTKRQSQVLGLILKGLSNKDIARELKLAEGTIKIHSIAIYRELGVSNRTQAALRARQLFAA